MKTNIQHPIRLVPQPTNMTCWSAAASMIFGGNLSVGAGEASISQNGGLQADFSNIEKFAQSLGLRMFAPQTWTVKGLINLLNYGPFIKMGFVPSGHAVVVSGIETDGDFNNTFLTIYDPWPPLIGKIEKVNYNTHLQQFPLSTFYILQK